MAMSLFQNNISKYKEFVIRNPYLASELESTLRWFSYLSAGRFSDSSVVSELIYASSSLLSLVNDSILRCAANIPSHVNVAVARLNTCLAVMEYSEVFAEMAAARLGGQTARWLIIVVIQIIKSGLRLVLLLRHRQGIQRSPPISPLNRKRDLPQSGANKNDRALSSSVELAVTLKRSGRSIRSLESTPPMSARTWKLPDTNKTVAANETTTKVIFPPTVLEGQRLAGELLHVLRPLAHLATMAVCGSLSWKPWFVALGIDMTSIQLLGDRRQLNQSEQLELSRRALTLLLYVLRSPFYDRFTKERTLHLLNLVTQNIPLTGMILGPLSEYLPEWQKTYLRSWMT